jgi:glycosyltransferase involved in cell wall biosynthesis
LAPENIKGRPLRVALIASERTLQEYSTYLEHLLIGLADESIPAAIVCPQGPDMESILTPAAQIIRYPVFELPLMGHLNRKLLADQLGRFNPTVLHCLCQGRAGLVRRIARKMNLPYILNINSLEKRMIHCQVSSKRCMKILVPSRKIKSNVIRVRPNFKNRIEQVNIGTFVSDKPVCFSAAHNVSTLITFHSDNNPQVFDNLLGAVKRLVIDGYEFVMIIISGNRAERQLWKLLDALDLLKVVTIIPRLKPYRPILATSDVFIRPEPSASFSTLLLEAMSVGTVVVSCTGGVDDLIIEDETAVIFDPKDELSILNALKKVLDRREFAYKIARTAQEHVGQMHTVSRMISSIIDVYKQA